MRGEWRRDGFTISTDRSRLQPEAIHAYLSRSYWAAGRTRAQVERSLKHSLCFGVFDADAQIGLARVVTDYTTFAYLCDVYVLEAYQGRGLGKWLMSVVMSHRDLQGLRRWSLVTRDAHGLYRRHGFKEVEAPERWMEISRTEG